MRRTATLTGFLGLALLPVAATAVSPDRSPIRVAIAQPIAVARAPLPVSSPRLSETALLMLVGTGLLGLGAVVRKAT